MIPVVVLAWLQLGFPRPLCERALVIAYGDPTSAANWLFEHGSEPARAAPGKSGDVNLLYGHSDVEFVRWCLNVILGHGFSGDRPGSAAGTLDVCMLALLRCNALTWSPLSYWKFSIR